MTTYYYTIILDDGEANMIRAALELMIKQCQEKLDEGATAPFWAHKKSAQNVLDRLNDNTIQESGNYFFNLK